jgi:hypothetical protein
MKNIFGFLLFLLMGLGETHAADRFTDWISQTALSIPGVDYAYSMAKNLSHLPKALYARGMPHFFRWGGSDQPQESDEEKSTEDTGSFSLEEASQDAVQDFSDKEIESPQGQDAVQDFSDKEIESPQGQDAVQDVSDKEIESPQGQDAVQDFSDKEIESPQGQALLAGELLGKLPLDVHKKKGEKKSLALEAPKVVFDTIVKGLSSSPHHLSVTPKNKSDGNKKHSLVNNVIVLPKNREALEELKKAQRKSVRQETLTDGKIVFYMHERPAINPDQTISVGHTYITKYDPKTGEVISWDEGHNSSGKVTRFRPKMVNSVHVTVPHYPPVYRDRQNLDFATDVKKFETVEGVRELLAQWQDIPQLNEFLQNNITSLEKKLFQHKNIKNQQYVKRYK